MKQIRFIAVIATAAALAITGCSKVSEIEAPEGQSVSQITATWADDQTKTVLGEDGTSILWSPNDEISVFYNDIGLKFTALNSNPAECTVFASDKPLVYGRTGTSGEPYLYAAYPYSSDNAQDGEYLTLTVPAAQTAVEGSFGRGAYPSVGRSKDTNISFYNVCGGIRFTLCQSGIRKIVLTGNNDENLAGKVKVKFAEDGEPEVFAIVSRQKSITLTAPDNGEFQTGKWYYISVLPIVLSEGFNMEFIKRTDESERGTRTISASREVKRSVFGSVENIDSGVSFKVGVASLSISPENVLIAPMTAAQLSFAVSPSEAQYEWIKWSSSDKTVATVDEDGMVVGKKDGKCTVTATSDNGKTASCTVYVSQVPVTTNAASDISYLVATLNGTFNVADAESVSKTVFFLYSDTETTLEGLKANGTRVETSLSGNAFAYNLKSLKLETEYSYVACVSFLDRDYYGEVKDFTTLAYSTPESVDLGLSVKWASFNIGATKPEEYVIYFAWGDVTGQTWDGSSWSGGGFNDYPAYELDENGNLKPAYDAAHVNLGGTWRMPTHTEQQELIDNCTSTWTSDYNGTGVAGRIFTSNKEGYTDKSIFLPAAGYGSYSELDYAGSYGYFWSSTFSSGIDAWYLDFGSDNVSTFIHFRDYGQSVRPVTE